VIKLGQCPDKAAHYDHTWMTAAAGEERFCPGVDTGGISFRYRIGTGGTGPDPAIPECPVCGAYGGGGHGGLCPNG
jgi:hypothetical protein